MPSNRFLVTSLCVLLVAAQVAYLVSIDPSGSNELGSIGTRSTNNSRSSEPSGGTSEPSGGTSEPVSTSASADAGGFAADSARSFVNAESRPPDPANPSGLSANNSQAEPEREQDREPAATFQAASVRVTESRSGIFGGGSIVAIDELGFDVLTAAHVIAGTRSLEIHAWTPQTPDDASAFPDGNVLRFADVTVVAEDKDLDLAWLRVETPIRLRHALDLPGTAVAKQLSAAVRRGEPVTAYRAGWMAEDRPTLEPVTIIGAKRAVRRRGDVAVNYFAVDQPTTKGDSGAGLFDRRGVLIGVASGNSGGRGYFCDAGEVSRFITEAAGSRPR